MYILVPLAVDARPFSGAAIRCIGLSLRRHFVRCLIRRNQGFSQFAMSATYGSVFPRVVSSRICGICRASTARGYIWFNHISNHIVELNIDGRCLTRPSYIPMFSSTLNNYRCLTRPSYCPMFNSNEQGVLHFGPSPRWGGTRDGDFRMYAARLLTPRTRFAYGCFYFVYYT